VRLVKAWAESLVKLQKIQVIDVSFVMSIDTADVTLEGYVLPQQLRVFKLSYDQPGMCMQALNHLTFQTCPIYLCMWIVQMWRSFEGFQALFLSV
jgi:hypothetical protein